MVPWIGTGWLRKPSLWVAGISMGASEPEEPTWNLWPETTDCLKIQILNLEPFFITPSSEFIFHIIYVTLGKALDIFIHKR
jgi:hypothetical protein